MSKRPDVTISQPDAKRARCSPDVLPAPPPSGPEPSLGAWLATSGLSGEDGEKIAVALYGALGARIQEDICGKHWRTADAVINEIKAKSKTYAILTAVNIQKVSFLITKDFDAAIHLRAAEARLLRQQQAVPAQQLRPQQLVAQTSSAITAHMPIVYEIRQIVKAKDAVSFVNLAKTTRRARGQVAPPPL
jgi:hypothetical protein